MAFKLVKNLTVEWPVHVEQPTDGGKTEKSTFTAQFKILSDLAWKELADSKENDLEIIKTFLTGWSELQDENGKELKFTPKNIELVLGLAYVRKAVFVAYNNAVSGYGDPETKN